MKTENKTYTQEEVEKIIEESVKQVKLASNFATEKTFKNANDKLEITMLSTAVIDGMEKTLKAKFGIKPKTVIKIESKEDFKKAIVDLLDAIFD